MSKQDSFLNRRTGVLIIEAVNSNPNGNPDQESDPRQRPDGRGEISPVSYKRKVRDLVENKDGPVWAAIREEMKNLKDEEFQILESRGRDRNSIEKEIKDGTFLQKYWDARVFGNTFLEEGASTSVKTGPFQFTLGISVSPVLIERHTNTNKAGVQQGKDRGMAPLAYRIVQHGVYVMPFYFNPSAATKSGCTQVDIEILLKIIPFAYSHSASYIRPDVRIRHAWVIEHKSPLGSCPDYLLVDALTPKRIGNSDEPSISWSADYDVPSRLPEDLQTRVLNVRDLMNQ